MKDRIAEKILTEKIFCSAAITSASPKVGDCMQVNWSPEKKRWGPRGFKIISNRLSVPRCQIFFVFNIVTGLNVSGFNQMYEILG